MANKQKRDALWAEAKRLCRLSAEEIRMAKEMGLNPRSLIKNIPNKSQQWKAPVNIWIRDIYEKRQENTRKKQARKDARVKNDAVPPLPESNLPSPVPPATEELP